MQHKDDMVRCRLHTYVLSRLLPPQSRKPFANGLLSIFNCVICNATRSRHVIYRWTVAPPPVRFSTTLNTGRSDAVRIGKYVKYRFSDVSVYYNVNIDSFIVSFVSFCIQDSVLTRAGSRWKRLDWPRTAPSQALGLVLGLDSPEIYCTKFIIKNWGPIHERRSHVRYDSGRTTWIAATIRPIHKASRKRWSYRTYDTTVRCS